MKVLIDTHIALWSMLEDSKLSNKALEILMDENNIIFYSTASVWEIAIKHIIRPNDIMIDAELFEKGCEENGYNNLPIFNKHTFKLKTLFREKDVPKHNDPFDRIMLAQAKAEGMKFMTHDSLISYYNESCVINV